jgi:hypothetical protein
MWYSAEGERELRVGRSTPRGAAGAYEKHPTTLVLGTSGTRPGLVIANPFSYYCRQ